MGDTTTRPSDGPLPCSRCGGKLDVSMTCNACGAVHIAPHPGPQEEFLLSDADITIFGGARGGGKSHGVRMRPIAGPGCAFSPLEDPGFTGLIFRREKSRLTGAGGMWEDARRIYPLLGGSSNENHLSYKFPSGAHIQFAGMEYEKDAEKYRGKAFVWIALEEGTEFTWNQFLALLRCNRPTSSTTTRPWMDITCNPDPDSWLLDLVRWFIYPEGHPLAGTPNPQRCGLKRFFTIRDNELAWIDELYDGEPAEWVDEDGVGATSVTYIPSSLTDNPTITVKDPSYLKKLKAQKSVQRARDLGGNWFARESSTLFADARVRWVRAGEVPSGLRRIRYWDFASSERKPGTLPDSSAGVRAAFAECPRCDGWRFIGPEKPCPTCNTFDGAAIVPMSSVFEPEQLFIIDDVALIEGTPGAVEQLVKETAQRDGAEVPVYLEEETGSSGKTTTHSYDKRILAEFEVHGDRPTGSKTHRAGPLVTAAERGLVWIVRNQSYDVALKDALLNFPGSGRDIIDAATGCYGAHLRHEWKEVGEGWIVA